MCDVDAGYLGQLCVMVYDVCVYFSVRGVCVIVLVGSGSCVEVIWSGCGCSKCVAG